MGARSIKVKDIHWRRQRETRQIRPPGQPTIPGTEQNIDGTRIDDTRR